MSWRTPILTFAVSIIAAFANPATARAIELRSTNQMPGWSTRTPTRSPSQTSATAALNISYLEGDWKSVQIPSGQYVTIPSQSTGLSVSFNDGVETKSLVLNRGMTYALYWNAGLSRWAIAPYDEVATAAGRLSLALADGREYDRGCSCCCHAFDR